MDLYTSHQHTLIFIDGRYQETAKNKKSRKNQLNIEQLILVTTISRYAQHMRNFQNVFPIRSALLCTTYIPVPRTTKYCTILRVLTIIIKLPYTSTWIRRSQHRIHINNLKLRRQFTECSVSFSNVPDKIRFTN